jgi:hypothetical protein
MIFGHLPLFVERKLLWVNFSPKSLFKIWNFGVANTKILPCRLQKSPKIGIFRSIYRKNPQFEQALKDGVVDQVQLSGKKYRIRACPQITLIEEERRGGDIRACSH